MKVIVTRPSAQGRDFIEQLHARGVNAVALPLIGIEPLTDRTALLQVWTKLDETDLAMFVSANAVQHFVDARPAGMGWPKSIALASPGPGTSAALLAAGVPSAQLLAPPAGGPYDSDTLWQVLRDRPWSGRRALVVRGEQGRDWLAEQLQQAGAQVEFGRRVAPISARRTRPVGDAQARPMDHLWHFSSSEGVEHLARLAPGRFRSQRRAGDAAIAETTSRMGFGRVHLVGVGAQAVADWLQVPDPGGPSIESATP
jgi:uroporphyrinogen-III synthase